MNMADREQRRVSKLSAGCSEHVADSNPLSFSGICTEERGPVGRWRIVYNSEQVKGGGGSEGPSHPPPLSIGSRHPYLSILSVHEPQGNQKTQESPALLLFL